MIYLDYAASTPPSQKTIELMAKAMRDYPANPSSLHGAGIAAKKRYNQAKTGIASVFNVKKDDLITTGSATEAINHVIKGTYFKHPDKTIVTTTIEHAAVKETCAFIRKQGGNVIEIPTDSDGFLLLETLKKTLDTNPVSLVSVIYANNETGVIQDVGAIRRLLEPYGVPLHLDMVQAPLHQKVDLQEIGADYASFSAHKFNGPKGVGLLYKKPGFEIESLIHGGNHEKERRAGTENLAAVIGTENALIESVNARQAREKIIGENARFFLDKLKALDIDHRLNGPTLDDARLNSILNIGFKDQDAQMLSFLLNEEAIYLSIGSACHSDIIEVSHVLRAMGVPKDYIKGSLRFSLSHNETKADLEKTAKTIKRLIDSGKTKK